MYCILVAIMGDQHLAFRSINFNPDCNWAIPVTD